MTGPQECGPVWRRRRILRLSWDGLAQALGELASSIGTADAGYDTILAIARGGLPVATYLSHALGITDGRYACVRRRKNDAGFAERGGAALLEWVAPDTGMAGRQVLVVDDIAGDGGTLQMAVAEAMARGAASAATAVLVRNDGCGLEPTYYVRTADDWTWFPWERPPAHAAVPVVDFAGAEVNVR